MSSEDPIVLFLNRGMPDSSLSFYPIEAKRAEESPGGDGSWVGSCVSISCAEACSPWGLAFCGPCHCKCGWGCELGSMCPGQHSIARLEIMGTLEMCGNVHQHFEGEGGLRLGQTRNKRGGTKAQSCRGVEKQPRRHWSSQERRTWGAHVNRCACVNTAVGHWAVAGG